ncbi:adhesin/invasin, partial [Kosakonia arachidis]
TVTVTATVQGVSGFEKTVAVTVQAGAPDAAQSVLTAEPGTLSAGETSRLTLTLRDRFGNAVPGQTVNFAASSGSLSAVSDGGDGSYTAELTDNKPGTVTVTATVQGVSGFEKTVAVTVQAGVPDAAQSGLTAEPDSITAGGRTEVILTLRDSMGNGLDGKKVIFTPSAGILSSVTPAGDGVYTAELTGTTAGTTTVTARVEEYPDFVKQVEVTVRPGHIFSEKTELTAIPDLVTVGEKSTLTMTLRDYYSNGLPGEKVEFTTSHGTLSGVTDKGDGTYVATLTTTSAYIAKVTASVSVESGAWIRKTTTVTFKAGAPDTDRSELTAKPDIITVSSRSVLTLSLDDRYHNSVPGQTVEFSTDAGTLGSVNETGHGVYTVVLTGTTIGLATVTARVKEYPDFEKQVEVTVQAGGPDAAQSVLTAEPGTISAGENSRLTLTLRDSMGNGLDGKTVIFTPSAGILSAVTPAGGGVYTAELTGTTAGTTTVTARVEEYPDFKKQVTVVVETGSPSKNSTVKVSKQTYIIGEEDVYATIHLTDKGGNPLSDKLNWLQSPNVFHLPGTDNQVWKEEATKGNYVVRGIIKTTGLYVAELNTEDGVSVSAPYILDYSKVADMSIDVDKDKYIVGNDLYVRLYLRDAWLNPVSEGEGLSFINSTRTRIRIPGVSEQADVKWSLDEPGVFISKWKATSPGERYKATLESYDENYDYDNGWIKHESRNYKITVPDAARSALGASPQVMELGATITLTLHLRDSDGDYVTGQTVKFIASANVINAEESKGIYTATMTPTSSGKDLVTAKVDGFPEFVKTVTITVW